jgi:hypothetical protein
VDTPLPQYVRKSLSLRRNPEVEKYTTLKQGESIIDRERRAQKRGNLGVPLCPYSALPVWDRHRMSALDREPVPKARELEFAGKEVMLPIVRQGENA